MQYTSYTYAPYKMRRKLRAQLLEGTDIVGCQPAEPYPRRTLQHSWESLAHDFVCNALQVYEGFERLQMIQGIL